jgi:hypothetical protein
VTGVTIRGTNEVFPSLSKLVQFYAARKRSVAMATACCSPPSPLTWSRSSCRTVQ